MAIIALLFIFLAIAAGLVSLACWIINIVVAFQHEDILMGVLSICGIVGFIIGWIKVGEWGHQKVMIAWTIAMIAGIGLQLVAGVIGAMAGPQLDGLMIVY